MKFENVLKNIRKVREISSELNKDLKIVLHMTIIPDNIEELPEFILRAKEFGADGLDFGHDRGVETLLKNDRELRERLKNRILLAFEEMKDTYFRTDMGHLKYIGLLWSALWPKYTIIIPT